MATVTGPGAIPFTKHRGWRRAVNCCWPALLLLLFLCRTGAAESTQETEFFPEVDGYLKLNKDIRVSFMAKDTRDGGDSTQAAIGPSLTSRNSQNATRAQPVAAKTQTDASMTIPTAIRASTPILATFLGATSVEMTIPTRLRMPLMG